MSQNKKCINLSEVSNKFTEKVLMDILSKACNEKEVQLLDWTLDDGFAKGDYYMSKINKGTVNGIISNTRQNVQVNFVVKAMPKSIGRRKTLRCADFFHNEIIFYTEIASRFEKFLADKGQSNLLCVPRHFVSFTDGENDFLVLEDASCLGFKPVLRKNCLKLEECIVIVKTMAKFHAISFAYKNQKREEFTKITNCLKEIFFGIDYWDWYKNYHEKLITITKNTLATEYPNSKAEKQFNSYKFGALYNMCTELCERKGTSTSVVCQGDCWAPNFLVRDDEQNEKEALILDFQVTRCASVILDLSFLIYSCTDKSFRGQYFDDILKIYHSELSNVIKLLGSDSEKIYPWDLFMKEVKEQFKFGLFAALEIIPLSITDVPQSFDLDSPFNDNEAIDIADLVTISNIATKSGRQRLADVIVHAVNKGYI